MQPGKASGNLVWNLCVKAVLWLAIMALLLLGGSGNWTWPQAWAFLSLCAATSVWFGMSLRFRLIPGIW